MSWFTRGLIHSSLFLIASLVPSMADNGWEGQSLSLKWDNDFPDNTDRHYTQGLLISYLSSDRAVPRWLERFSDHLPALGLEVQARKFGLGVGQEIYTPANLVTSALVTNDRPYAGWLFGSFVLQRRGQISSNWLGSENIRLDLGIVGPESLAQGAQESVHYRQPRGWRHQLKTEPAFALRGERRFLYRIGDGAERWGADLMPYLNGSGGTVATFLGFGTEARFGYRIPNQFEAPKQSTPVYSGAYVFTGAEGRYVVRNIFLDGNTFTSSHHIDKQPWVADFRVGFTVVLERVELTLAQTLRTREFKGQGGNDAFATAVVVMKF